MHAAHDTFSPSHGTVDLGNMTGTRKGIGGSHLVDPFQKAACIAELCALEHTQRGYGLSNLYKAPAHAIPPAR